MNELVDDDLLKYEDIKAEIKSRFAITNSFSKDPQVAFIHNATVLEINCTNCKT